MIARVLTASAFGTLLLVGSQAAQAGGGCGGSACYNLVTTPPVYGTVAETYVARPEQVERRVIPAEYDYVTETVMIRPARKVARPIPAQYSTVTEKVMLSPGGKRWEVSTDKYGRTTGCWVYDKPRYGYQTRTVEVSPASVAYDVVPAVYSERQRRVMVRPTQVVRESIPAVYETRQRKVLVSPGSQYWAKGGY